MAGHDEVRAGMSPSATITASPLRAWAWLRTVLVPLLRALAIEEEYARLGPWTWRSASGRCELIAPARELVSSLYTDNFDDLLRHREDVRRAVERHDVAVSELLRRLQEEQGDLEHDSSFIEAVVRCFDLHHERHPEDQPWAPWSRERLIPLAAQWLLNAEDPLDARESDQPFSCFWAEQHTALMTFQSGRLDLLRARAGAVAAEARELELVLSKARVELCDAHGLPPVPVE